SRRRKSCLPIRSPVPSRVVGLRSEIKEEAAAAGGGRGTFAEKARHPRRDQSDGGAASEATHPGKSPAQGRAVSQAGRCRASAHAAAPEQVHDRKQEDPTHASMHSGKLRSEEHTS